MTSYFQKLSPVPAFPQYAGPLPVGTVDVELPVAELSSPSPAPDETIPTIQYRVFYPCVDDPKGCKHKQVNWIPAPQRSYVAAYSRFLGLGQTASQFVSVIPSVLSHITIPACKNATLADATSPSQRWPVMIFSHGLGGTRNAYSHLLRSVASHGVIVISPEHRDGSAPIAHIRDVPSSNGGKRRSKRAIDYIKMPHKPTPEVQAARDAQLKIRLWELGLIFDSLLKIDAGVALTNLNSTTMSMAPFTGKLAIHEPGSVTFSGHSFGAATTAQFVKSIYYAAEAEGVEDYKPLFTPALDCALRKQITPHTPAILLDIWCLPLKSPQTAWLWSKPMPCYAPDGPGGERLLAVESQFFWGWRTHLKTTKRLLSPDPTSDNADFHGRSEPRFYYPDSSAHLSQSDFGILFPWLCKKAFDAQEPERLLRLNIRAMLQLMREAGVPVQQTSVEDMEMSTVDSSAEEATQNDTAIFGRDGEVRGWNWISTDLSDLTDVDSDEDLDKAGDPETTAAPATVEVK